MIKEKYQIIPFKKSHIPKIRELYKLSYNRTKPLEVFNYKLGKTPDGNPIGYLMKIGKMIVGFYVIIPISIELQNKSVLGGLSLLTMTHPEHQRKGIFRKLAKKTFISAKKNGYKFVVGFSMNENSLDGFKKLGWSVQPIYYRKIFLKRRNSKKFHTTYKNNFPKKIEELWEKFDRKEKFEVKRLKNKKFFDWRYIENPTKYHFIFDKEKYFVVLKKYDKILNVVDYFANVPNFDKILLDIVTQKARKLNCQKITIWWPEIKNQKIEKGFSEKIQSSNYFGIKKLDPNLSSKVLSSENWYFTMSDSDVF